MSSQHISLAFFPRKQVNMYAKEIACTDNIEKKVTAIKEIEKMKLERRKLLKIYFKLHREDG